MIEEWPEGLPPSGDQPDGSRPDVKKSGEEKPGEESFVELFSRLLDDGEHFVLAELQLYRARLLRRLDEGRVAIVMIAVAFFLSQAALVALLVGLVATLRRPLGPAGATAAVVLTSLAIAGVLVWLGLKQLRKATELRSDAPPHPPGISEP